MADTTLRKETSLSPETVINNAVQFFATEKWRPTTQSARAATFQGMPRIPWVMLVLTIVGFLVCIVPGIICYILFIKKARKFQNLVITVESQGQGTAVTVTCPEHSRKLAERFLEKLPA